tara:strand:+ start:2521 stop:3009 length:489 start_codon:yes stop_codon:yes gene_type:complete
MIQATTETDLTFYIQTEDNRIDKSAATSKIRHLLKFTNDMDKSVHYVYGSAEDITARHTKFEVDYDPPGSTDMYLGSVALLPAGYWKYEVYEVVWSGTVTIANGSAPATENDVLTPAASTKGVVQGLVTKGIMYVAEKDGTEQVQYKQHEETSGTNYIYYGQ